MSDIRFYTEDGYVDLNNPDARAALAGRAKRHWDTIDLIDACFIAEEQAANSEYAAVARKDHHEAALYNAMRWRYMDRIGVLMQLLDEDADVTFN